LKERADAIKPRLTFVGKTDDELAKLSQDHQVAAEEREREAESWPEGSAKRTRLQDEAYVERTMSSLANKEIAARTTMANAKESAADIARQLASTRAQEAWKSHWDGELQKLTAHVQPGVPGLSLAPPGAGPDWRPPQPWEAERARAMRDQAPPDEWVQKFHADALKDLQERMPYLKEGI
jgi:hypothetical protein